MSSPSSPRAPGRLTALLLTVALLALLVPAAWHVVAAAKLMAAQVQYPFDIEWMEGGQLYHAYRVTHSQPLYGPPSQGFIPYPYPPLHAWTLALAGRLFGLDFATGRLVSVAALVLGLLLLVHVVTRHAGGRLLGLTLGLVAASQALASIPVVQGWFAFVRTDTFAIAVATAAAVAAERAGRSRPRAFLAALLLVATVWAKQTGLFFAAWIVIWALATDWRLGSWLAALSLLVSGALLAVCQIASDGWFVTWLLVQKNHLVTEELFPMGTWTLVRFAPHLVAVPLLAAYAAGRGWLTRRAGLWVGMLAAALPASLLPYAKAGGWINNFIPVLFLVGPVSFLVVIDVASGLASRPRLAAATLWGAAALGALFLCVRTYDVAAYRPTPELTAKARAQNRFVKGLPGGVIVPCLPFLPIANGHDNPQFHCWPYADAINGQLTGFELGAYVRDGRARWAIMTGFEGPYERETLLRFFEPAGVVPDPVGPFIGAGPNVPTTLLARRAPRRKQRLLFDFETPKLAQWRVEGTAFGEGALPVATPGIPAILGQEGRGLICSFPPGAGDGATGALMSPPFTVDRPRLGLLVGGGSAENVRVDLVVDSKIVRTARGSDMDILSSVEWDVAEFAGKQANLAVLDLETGPWGHILVDQVELFEDSR